jgi:hypothetical protein
MSPTASVPTMLTPASQQNVSRLPPWRDISHSLQQFENSKIACMLKYFAMCYWNAFQVNGARGSWRAQDPSKQQVLYR